MIKTTSLETSKLLKENGFRQDSHFFYSVNPRPKEQRTISELDSFLHCITNNMKIPCDDLYFSAPTTDELLEELPCLINDKSDGCRLNIDKVITRYQVRYGNYVEFRDKELPEALAKMWLYLKKEGLNGRS